MVKKKPKKDESPHKIQTTPRTCLRCGITFESTGPGNRICGPCSRGKEAGIKTANRGASRKGGINGNY